MLMKYLHYVTRSMESTCFLGNVLMIITRLQLNCPKHNLKFVGSCNQGNIALYCSLVTN